MNFEFKIFGRRSSIFAFCIGRSATALGLMLSGLALTGCTQKSETTTMNIVMPDWNAVMNADRASRNAGQALKGDVSAMSEPPLTTTRVMINISAPDLETQVLIWDLRSNFVAGQPLPVAPKTFSFNVNRGANRLFQVLAIGQVVSVNGDEGESQPMTFYYGDLTKSLTLAEENLELRPTKQGTSTGAEGSVSGRFLNAAGNGPSGKLNMFYAPPGRPEMIVDTGSIFSGFFQVFLPAEAQFSFRTADGTTILDKVNLDSFEGATSSSFVKIKVPAGFRSNGPSSRRALGETTRFIGFVGAPAAGKKVCVDSNPGYVSDLFMSEDLNNFEQIPWLAASADPSYARVLGGGVLAPSGLCPASSGIENEDYFEVRTSLLSNGDSAIGHRGPFSEVTPGTNNFLSSSYSAAGLSLLWKYLKPTVGDSVSGVGIFTKTYPAGESMDNRWHDSAPCSKLVSDFGFTEVTRVAAGSSSAPVENYLVTGVPAAAYVSGRHMTVVCPYSTSGNYYEFALVHRSNSGSYQSPATQIIVKRFGDANVTTSASRTTVARGVCTPIVVRTADSAGNIAYRAGATGPATGLATLIGAAGDANLFLDSDCSSGSPNQTIYIGGEHTFYIRTDSPTADFEIQVADTSSGGVALPTTTYFGQSVTPVSSNQLIMSVRSSAFAYECIPVTLVRGFDVSGEFVPQGGSAGLASFNANVTAYPGLNYFMSSDCSGSSIQNASFSLTSTSSAKVFARYSGPSSSIFISPDASAIGLSSPAQMVTISQPGPASQLRVFGASQIQAETCVPIRITSLDSNSRFSPSAVAQNVPVVLSPSLPAPSGIFTDSMCSIPASTVEIPAGGVQSAMHYLRIATGGSYSLTAASATPFVPFSLSVSAATMAAVVTTVPGVGWTFVSGYQGFGAQKAMGPGSLFQLRLEARSPLGNLVTAFNEPNIGASGLNLRNQFGETPNCLTSAIWSGGIAQLSCWIPYTGSHPYSRVQFSSGGGPSSYPASVSEPLFFAAKSGETEPLQIATTSFRHTSGSCVPYLLTRRVLGLYPSIVDAASVVTLTGVGATLGIYADDGCSAGAITNVVINSGESSKIVYALSSGSGNPFITAESTSAIDPATASTPSVTVGTVGPAANYRITVSRSLIVGACEPVMVVRTDVNGARVPADTNVTLNFIPTNLMAEFFTSQDCAIGTQTASVPLLTGRSTALLFMRVGMSTANGTLQVDDSFFSGTASGIIANP